MHHLLSCSTYSRTLFAGRRLRRRSMTLLTVGSLVALVACDTHPLTPASRVISTGAGVSTLIPSSGTWTALSPMPTARFGLVAASLNGLVYAIGGSHRVFDFHSIGFFGVTSVEAYNPVTDTWRAVAPLPLSRVYANGAGVIGGRIYVTGGAGCDSPIGNCRETSTLYIFDPAAGPMGTWTAGPQMPFIIEGGTAGVINNQLYVLAGWSIGAPRNYLLRFDPVSNAWTQLAPSPSGHTFGASTTLNGKFYAFGGEGTGHALDIYDPATNTWTSKTMPVGYQHHTAVEIGGILYLTGGSQFIGGVCCVQNIVMAYDPQDDFWTTPAPVVLAGGPYVGSTDTP